MTKGVEVLFCAFLIMYRVMEALDVLKASAEAYSRLLAYEYRITGGRKGKTIDVVIGFPEDAYHHLAGFQYSRIELLRQQKGALRCILDEWISYEQLLQSGFQHSDRLECIIALQERLETNQFVFRYREHQPSFSHISADFLFSWDDIVFFTSNNIPVSIFKNSNGTNYAQKCPRYTVLKIERLCKATGECITVYQRF